jgi:hypothetical protein
MRARHEIDERGKERETDVCVCVCVREREREREREKHTENIRISDMLLKFVAWFPPKSRSCDKLLDADSSLRKLSQEV